jgi:hypothetical protein
LQLELIEKAPGRIFSSTNKLIIKFRNLDEKEEFKQFFNRYCIDEEVD